jgi:Co/Zn/Cd efflux system component
MIVEGGVAISAGITAGSLTLKAFGLPFEPESVTYQRGAFWCNGSMLWPVIGSACVLVWRLNVELQQGRSFSERAERTASKIGGALLLALAAYIVVAAPWRLWTQQGEAFSLPGLIVAFLAIPIMTLLARRKIAVATQLGSRAMRADAVESITCGWLSVVVVVGLLADLLLGAWWVDAVTSLAIVWFVIKEGREAWIGNICCDDD